MNSRIVVGLDVGTTKVAAVVGMLNEQGEVDILGIGKAKAEGVVRGSIYHIDKTVAAIRQAVEMAEQQANVDIGSVYLGISGEHVRAVQQKNIITLGNAEPEITQADVDRLCRDMYNSHRPAGSEILHVIPQDFCVDDKNAVRDPVGMSGIRLEGNFHIVTADEQAIKTLYRTVEKAGLDVAGLLLQGIASATATLSEEEKEAGVVLLDMGGGTSDLVVYKNGVLRHTEVIPFGGDVVTLDIMKGFNLMQKHAEALKQNYGVALASKLGDEEIISISSLPGRAPREISRQTLAKVIQARLSEIAAMVVHQLELAHINREELFGGLVLTGGGARLPFVDELFEYATHFDCRIYHPADRLGRGLVQEINHPAFSTAVGLMMYGLFDDAQTSSPRKTGRDAEPRLWKKGDGQGRLVSMVKGWFEKTVSSSID